MPVNSDIDKRNENIQIYINGSFYKRDDETLIHIYMPTN